MSKIKRIGVLTSGGDCSGLNAVIRAVVHHATLHYGWEVYGINDGTKGLMDRPMRYQKLTVKDVDTNVLRMGGTFLGTVNSGDPFAYPMPDGSKRDRSDEVIAGYRELGLDALISMGGDGSMAILRRMAQQGGINFVGVPKTIDNDLGATENALGYDTAVQVATEALDRLQPTAASHHRVMILEVMGRDAGHIALTSGIAGGADIILIPEIQWNMAAVKNKIENLRKGGRNFALVVVSEAVKTEKNEPVMHKFADGQVRYGGIGQYLGTRIAQETGAETRVTVLGHVQRGGQPSALDRMLASSFGVHAVDLVAQGKFDRIVVWQNRTVRDVPISEAIASYRAVELDGAPLKTARGLGICLGDK
ncbi:MAG: ATP-dependent 6-phosphofructokinase [Alphaproteobacteria bacterium]|nr:MAG: ATP-dependent 6-phosphofructokinase [Alphaproteobacteria bacterium]